MKKIYTLIAAVAVVFSANAQYKAMSPSASELSNLHPYTPQLQIKSAAAMGDTLFYFDGNNFSGLGISATSVPPFDFANDDIDGKTCDPALAGSPFDPTSAFVFYYELLPTPGDTNVYIAANSWFTPVGISDDWFAVGPITIPAAGAHVKVGDNYNDPAYRDAFKLLVSTTGLSNYTDFTDPAILTIGDNSSLTVTDTAQWPNNQFVMRGASLMSFAGQDIYIAIQHQANDRFIINMDDLVVLEGPMGVASYDANGFKVFQNSPNPTNGISAIGYELENSADVSLFVYDVTGKIIAEQSEGNVMAGQHVVKFNASSLSAGIYYYSLKVDNNSSSTMKMVVVK